MTTRTSVHLPSIRSLFQGLQDNLDDTVNSDPMASSLGNVSRLQNNLTFLMEPRTSDVPSLSQPQSKAYQSPPRSSTELSVESVRSAQILESLSSASLVPRYSQPVPTSFHNQGVYTPIPTPISSTVTKNYEHSSHVRKVNVLVNDLTPESTSENELSTDSNGSNKGKRCACKKSHSFPQHIPRPRNAFILFRQHLHPSLFPKDKELLTTQGSFKTNSDVSREIGQRWRQLSDEEKKYWQALAQKEKEEHRKKYPDYKYTPRKLLSSHDSDSDNDKKRKYKGLCEFCRQKKKHAHKAGN
ncbi:hypothetical protein KAFR_0G02830 [Kazachstania africana CBS 2517]|uniref:HMG box domain-containing protein n=1 Tax=Kazachstania africana (strain ATCC 22294 / BCRC 22015 / CBS 2517 / CECT 1963 / NBRC 1671 / NRRL Y-8276) TaxID=1071382 RepID=H2AY65_KAZAF|nr:hypothetical protein KAFR_0G02830 [Kazachstania africana CBS 2517]CCF59315.1 hypothetical protein KAFR_0G02830 [Kazachstania africana CBS 2517]